MDIALSFTERGAGFPLVLLHGNGEDSGYFANQLDALSPHFRVIAVDTRGHGRSPRGKALFSLAQFAEDLKGFFDLRQIERANILGFSDGGNIALLFALKYPERVGRLILNGANLSPEGLKPLARLPVDAGYWLASLASRFSEGAAAERELLGLMANQPHIRPEELSALDMPVLVIAGERDMIKESHTRLIAASIKEARLRIIEGGHFIAAENSARFNAETLDFLLG